MLRTVDGEEYQTFIQTLFKLFFKVCLANGLKLPVGGTRL